MGEPPPTATMPSHPPRPVHLQAVEHRLLRWVGGHVEERGGVRRQERPDPVEEAGLLETPIADEKRPRDAGRRKLRGQHIDGAEVEPDGGEVGDVVHGCPVGGAPARGSGRRLWCGWHGLRG